MTNLAEFSNPNVQIRSASLHILNKKTLKMGAGKTYDIDVHKGKKKTGQVKNLLIIIVRHTKKCQGLRLPHPEKGQLCL